MPKPILNAPAANAAKLELLRQHFPQAVETDAQGRIRINAEALQLALDPSNPAGIQVEEDGYELRWVGKREAYHTQALYLVVETKSYDSEAEIPTKEQWKIASAKKFFAALGSLPELQQNKVQIHYQTKINGEALAQLISSIK